MNDPDRLYVLLPVVDRERDAAGGWPLRALLQAMAGALDVVEDEIAQAYDNWFVDTCQDDLVPYLAELIGETGLPVSIGGPPSSVTSPRRDLATSVRRRRRKGTVGALEELGDDVAGWPTRVVEGHHITHTFVHLDHPRLERTRSLDIRDQGALDLVDGPFDTTAHRFGTRPAPSPGPATTASPAEVAAYVWRLRSEPRTAVEAACIESVARYCFTVDTLGVDRPLFLRPAPRSGTHPRPWSELPIALTRRFLEAHLDEIYGPGRSLWITVGAGGRPVPVEEIVVADLSRSGPRSPDKVAVDPELGRIVLPGNATDLSVVTTSHVGRVADLGGGEYRRPMPSPRTDPTTGPAPTYRVGPGQESNTIGAALALWRAAGPPGAVIELVGNDVYTEQIEIDLGEDQDLNLRAADGCRPVIRLLDFRNARADEMRITGTASSRFTLDGIVVKGRPLLTAGSLGRLELRHCTLVPGWDIDRDCCPTSPTEPSLVVTSDRTCVSIIRSIVGAIVIDHDEVANDPIGLDVDASVIDATSTAGRAIGGADGRTAHAVIAMRNTTVFGTTDVHAVELVDGSILTGALCVRFRQDGCIRFSSTGTACETPRRYRCQPDLAVAAGGFASDVEPRFESTRYGTERYARLASDGPPAIATGAEDGAEMGVYHDLYHPQRLQLLRQRIVSFVPAGITGDIHLVN